MEDKKIYITKEYLEKQFKNYTDFILLYLEKRLAKALPNSMKLELDTDDFLKVKLDDIWENILTYN